MNLIAISQALAADSNTWFERSAHCASTVRSRRSHGKRAITADTALRLGKYFGTSAQFWLNLQAHYDLDIAEGRVAEQIEAITPLQTA